MKKIVPDHGVVLCRVVIADEERSRKNQGTSFWQLDFVLSWKIADIKKLQCRCLWVHCARNQVVRKSFRPKILNFFMFGLGSLFEGKQCWK